uniref:Isopentenyltransferase n=1 Tax=Solanum tuberosum TaxID=4113 RepID=M1CJN5_SOLTU
MGKSRLSVDLATHFRREIINSDKMQVYKGLDIMTNKITHAEKQGVRHYLLGEIEPDSDFTAEDFCLKSIIYIETKIISFIKNNNKFNKKKVVFIGEATGTGKSRLSVDLTTHFRGEIINSEGSGWRSSWGDAPDAKVQRNFCGALAGATPQALAQKIPRFSFSFFISKLSNLP